MRLALFLVAAGIALAADAPKQITPELQTEYATAYEAAQIAQAEAEAAATRLAALKAGKALSTVVAKMQAVCPLELDAAGKPVCKPEPPKPAK